MISYSEFVFIKEKLFELIDFHFDGEITIKKFNGVKVEYDGKNAVLGCKDKTTLARALFVLCTHAPTGAFTMTVKI